MTSQKTPCSFSRVRVVLGMLAITAASGYASYELLQPALPTPLQAHIAQAATSAPFSTMTPSELAQPSVHRALLTATLRQVATERGRLEVDPRLLEMMPPTPGNRELMAAHADYVMGQLAKNMGVPESQRPHYKDLLKAMGDEWQKEKVAPEDVVALLRQERAQNAIQGKSAVKNVTNSATAMALTPYLMDAGMCSGDMFGETGIVCNYIDRDPGGAHISGDVQFSTGAPKVAMKEVPADSELAKILAAARNPASPMPMAKPQPASGGGSQMTRTDQTLWRQLADLAVSPARADDGVNNPSVTSPVPTPVPVPSTLAVPTPATPAAFDINKCTTMVPSQAKTQVVKIDPYLLGILLFEETVGRISDPGSPKDAAANAAMATFVKNWLSATQKVASDGINNRSNKYIDNEAKHACNNYLMTDPAYNECYAKAYKARMYSTVGYNYALSLTTTFIEQYVIQQAIVGGHDLNDATDATAGVFALKTLLQATAQFNVYGHIYQLQTVQYGLADADQVFVVYPYGFSCSADQCASIAQCAIRVDSTQECVKTIGRVQTWDLEPQGANIQHSINSCTASAVNYSGRLPYGAVQLSKAQTGKSGLPQDIDFRSTYQIPGIYPEPNRCAEPYANGSTNALDVLTAAQGQKKEHTCPFPSTKYGPTDPTPVLGGVGVVGPATNPPKGTQTFMGPILKSSGPQEQIPLWVWNFSKTDSGMNNYTAIYAGLTSTKAAYDAANSAPSTPAGVATAQCSSARTFNGLTSAPGDSFWAFHGEAYREADVSTEAVTAASIISALAFKDMLKGDPSTKSRYAAYITVSGLVASLFPVGKTYDCSVFPFSTSVLCQGGGSGINIAASRTIHPMPEVNVLLSDTLSHSPQVCNADRDLSAPQIYVLGGRVGKAAAGKTSDLPFVIERTGNLSATASVDYATLKSTGQYNDALEGQDFRPTSGRVTFLPGEEKKTVIVTALGNNSTDGSSKRVRLNIANPSGASTPGDTSAIGNITNDNPPG